jgi:hypothetical protein
MPVRKFRSVEQMNQPAWHRPGDPALYQAIASVWNFGRQTHPRLFEPGVRRYTSFDEMRRAQDELEAKHVQAVRARRRRPPPSPG